MLPVGCSAGGPLKGRTRPDACADLCGVHKPGHRGVGKVVVQRQDDRTAQAGCIRGDRNGWGRGGYRGRDAGLTLRSLNAVRLAAGSGHHLERRGGGKALSKAQGVAGA